MSLAQSWQSAHGFPPEVLAAFRTRPDLGFDNVYFLAGFVEFKTKLPSRGHASQSDLMVIGKVGNQLVVVAVEGKANEGFSSTVASWLKADKKGGRRKRLNSLCSTLGVSPEKVQNVRYQLIHRAVSAIETAKDFNAQHAIMLVHAFANRPVDFLAYSELLSLLNLNAAKSEVQSAGCRKGINLHFCWVPAQLARSNTRETAK